MALKPKPPGVRRIVAVVMAILFVVAVLPMPYLASPRWAVSVVTEDSKPLPGINVRLVYENYSAEGQDHEITMRTDKNGQALFPPQYAKASFLQRVFYTLMSAEAGVHASFGRHAYVFAFGDGYQGEAVSGKYVTDWNGSPESIESRIIASR
jgi:hypothetical protein